MCFPVNFCSPKTDKGSRRLKIKIFNREICVRALLDTNSLCAKSSAEMDINMILQKRRDKANVRFHTEVETKWELNLFQA